MKITLVRKFLAIVPVALCSQFAMADNASSAIEIAGFNAMARAEDKASITELYGL